MPTDRQRMILQRTATGAPSSDEVADRVRQSPSITLLHETAPSSLLVEGSPETIATVVDGIDGWQASPVQTYAVPDPRPSVLKPTRSR